MRTPSAHWLVCAASALPTLGLAQGLRSAATVLDRSVEVTGGANRYENLATQVQSGCVELSSQQIRGTLTIFRAAPNRVRTVMELPLGIIEEGFDGRCSLRTWVYRVAHHAAASHVSRQRRTNSARWVSLEQVAEAGARDDVELEARQHDALNHLMNLVGQLEPLDRRVILSCLESLDAASIGEITGISPRNVATRIHRVKPILARRFQEGRSHGE